MINGISYAITTHNEGECIEKLIQVLLKYKTADDEIVVVDDYSSDNLTRAILEEHEADENIRLFTHALNNDFAAHKNFMNDQCFGKWIFNIDADEIPPAFLMENIHEVVGKNNHIDMFLIPRINIVEGLTEAHIKKWGWRVNSAGHVNFPDYQTRLYQNKITIRWQGKVHERLVGYEPYASLPQIDEYALIHIKDIQRQETQNQYYDTLL